MSYKCRICGSNDVENPEDICELCARGQDPHTSVMGGAQTSAQVPDTRRTVRQIPLENCHTASTVRKRSRKVLINGGGSLASTDPCEESVTAQSEEEPSVQVHSAGQTLSRKPQNSTAVTSSNERESTQNTAAKPADNGPITSGITKNISVDTRRRSFLYKWFRALFLGIPFTWGNNITMFQVFPDNKGTALNALGNACDQVIVYGRVDQEAIAVNNEVEVYGRRDSDNNIVAGMIKNKASGTTVTPEGTVGAAVIWIITALIFAGITVMIRGLIGS